MAPDAAGADDRGTARTRSPGAGRRSSGGRFRPSLRVVGVGLRHEGVPGLVGHAGQVQLVGEPLLEAVAALHVDDVAVSRSELESKVIEFLADTMDTGVCHMALFRDPDGNDLMLHHRYAPYENA